MRLQLSPPPPMNLHKARLAVSLWGPHGTLHCHLPAPRRHLKNLRPCLPLPCPGRCPSGALSSSCSTPVLVQSEAQRTRTRGVCHLLQGSPSGKRPHERTEQGKGLGSWAVSQSLCPSPLWAISTSVKPAPASPSQPGAEASSPSSVVGRTVSPRKDTLQPYPPGPQNANLLEIRPLQRQPGTARPFGRALIQHDPRPWNKR